MNLPRKEEVRARRVKERTEVSSHGAGPPSSLCRLSDLPLWTDAVVESVHGATDVRRRLLEMGFCNRAVVTAIRRAPLGDPVEFFLRGYYVSLRGEEARCVLVVLRSSVPTGEDMPSSLRE